MLKQLLRCKLVPISLFHTNNWKLAVSEALLKQQFRTINKSEHVQRGKSRVVFHEIHPCMRGIFLANYEVIILVSNVRMKIIVH